LSNAENDLSAAEAALEKEIVTARATLASAMAAKAALEVARQRQLDMTILAPVSSSTKGSESDIGYAVTKRTVAEGQMLKESDAVYELVIENPLRLWANVPERFSPEIALGQEVRLSVASRPDATFEGKVARINPAVDAGNRTVQVETVVPNAKGLLRPGGFAKAEIVTRRDSGATVVPIESVVRFAGVTKIFIVEGDSRAAKARAVSVETGLEGPGWVEVIGSVPANGRVVTSGQTQLADGTPVVVREEEAKVATAEAGG
jgi:RND family efflux transporter MFP subunit